MPASVFDRLAPEYDARFSDSVMGSLLRQAVWRRLDACFQSGHRIVELNCGTGVDAVYLAKRGVRVLATDRSEAMVDVTRTKVLEAGLTTMVDVRRAAIEPGASDVASIFETVEPASEGRFDGALSNFGGLNCVQNLDDVARGLAGCLRAGAVAVVCVMGPVVPWEWFWYLVRARPDKAFRRFRPGGAWWHGVRIHYPSIARIKRAFAPHFRFLRASALGVLVPPPYAERWAAKHPKLLRRLWTWERRVEYTFPFPWLADHYLAEFERVIVDGR